MLKIKLSKRGFSLIEMMVAVAIISIVSIGIFQSYKAGFLGMSDAKMRTIATNIAQEKLEEIKGKTLDVGTYPDPDNPIVVSGKEFNAIVIVEEETTTLKKIIATISWQKRYGGQRQISIESLQAMATASPSGDVATAILVSVNPASIDIGETTQIKVTILDQDNYPISYNGQVDLLFIPDTPVLGTLTDNPLTFNGESYLFTTFTATDAGEVDVKAESTGLISDSDTITITGGAPAKINLVVDPTSVLINGETSTLNVRIEDENGYLADSWTGTVQLSITSGEGTGDLGNPSAGDIITINFVDENVKTTLFTSSTEAGEAFIEVTDITSSTPLTPDTETIYVSSGPPTQIDIEADPKNIFIADYGDGPTSSTITVTIKNATDIPTSGFVGTVTLYILSGEDSGTLDTTILSFNGESELSTTFNSSDTPGTVEIKAEDTTGGSGYTPLTPDNEIIAVAAGPPTKIRLDAIPDIILNNGIDSAIITVITEDSWGNRSGFLENTTITLSADQSAGNIGEAGNSKDIYFEAGESLKITTFTCDNTYEGVITITASGGGLSGDPVNITVAPVIIRPAENPNIQYGYHYFWWWKIIDENIIYFDIEILGGNIEIDKIEVSWTPNNNERLSGLRINNSDGDTTIDGTWDGKLSVVEILQSDFGTYNYLVEGISSVRLLFNTDIMQKNISIKFFTNFEDYQLEFLSPDQIV